MATARKPRCWKTGSYNSPCKHAQARSTNFYEVDLPEALTGSGDTDPNEAFRYF